MPLATLTYISTILTVLSVIVGFVGYVRGWWESPERKEERDRQKSMADALLGEADVLDRSGAILEKGKPGLVARTATLEAAFVKFVDQDRRIGRVEQAQADDHARIKANDARDDVQDAAIAIILGDKWEKGATAALKVVEKQQAGASNEEHP